MICMSYNDTRSLKPVVTRKLNMINLDIYSTCAYLNIYNNFMLYFATHCLWDLVHWPPGVTPFCPNSGMIFCEV